MIAVAPSKEKLLQVAQQLPASPQVLMQLGELLTDVNSGLEDVSVLLRRDTALAARVIRISNSVAFGMCGRVETVEEAVNRVGYAEIYRLVGLATAAQLGDLNLTYYGISGIQLRDNTLVAALAAEALAMRTGSDARVAYTTGLLRSTGKLVLDRYARRSNLDSRPFLQSGKTNLLSWEVESFGCTNVDVARTILSAWRFPNTIVEPICNQFSTTGAPSIHDRMSILLRAACIAAREQGVGLFGETECPDVAPEELKRAGLTPSLVTEVGEEAKIAFEAIRSSL